MTRALSTILAATLFAAAAYALFQFRQRMQNTALNNASSAPLTAAAVACFVVFIFVNVSDWPGTVLAQFWAEHAIFAATASTLPLVGVGYFAFEAHDQHVERELDSKVAATARGGLVDHLGDVDVTLSSLSWPRVDIVARWPDVGTTGRPLRCLRHHRNLLGREGSGILATDPRALRPLEHVDLDVWHQDLVDQCIRRIMAGIKEWGPLLSRSRDGRQDLVKLGELRSALVTVTGRASRLAVEDIWRVQQQFRLSAASFEQRSVGGLASLSRAEVLVPQEVPA